MKAKIIDVAGKVWRVLGERGKVALSKLPWYVHEDEYIVWQALGWLAREDKINYLKSAGEDFVALVDKELQVYRGLYGQKAYAQEVHGNEKFSWKGFLNTKIF